MACFMLLFYRSNKEVYFLSQRLQSFMNILKESLILEGFHSMSSYEYQRPFAGLPAKSPIFCSSWVPFSSWVMASSEYKSTSFRPPTGRPKVRTLWWERRADSQAPDNKDGQPASGLKLGDPRVMALFLALILFWHGVNGFRNADLRRHVTDLLDMSLLWCPMI